MFSHIFIGTNDFERALAFYRAVLTPLGLPERFADPSRPWAAWSSPGGGRPLLIIGRPYDGQPAAAGNGAMAAFLAEDRETVRACHAAAIANGGTCEGPPGLRPEYHARYYGAYFRDPDGNKLCVASHGDA